MTVVSGVDLSMTRTGVTVIHGPGNVAVCSVTSRPSDTSLRGRSLRLRRLAGLIYDLVESTDLIVVEAPSYGSSGAGTWDRAGLWWLVVGRLTGTGRQVVEVPPSSLKMYALGKGGGGGTGKDDMVTAAVRRYPDVAFSGNDEADSLFLAAMGARFVGAPIDDLPQTHLRAMSGVKWTTTTT